MSGGFEEKLNAILGDKVAMGQIMALAQSLSGKTETAEDTEGDQAYVAVEESEPMERTESDLGGVLNAMDPSMVRFAMSMVQAYNQGDEKTQALLTALRPFVKPSRYAKLDRAARAARLSRVVRILLDTLKEGRGGCVMYNRYISECDGTQAEQTADPQFRPEQDGVQRLLSQLGLSFGRGGGDTKHAGIAGMLKGMGLEDLDSGDILLLLILLLVFLEGDNTELVITLGLMVLLGGEGNQRE